MEFLALGGGPGGSRKCYWGGGFFNQKKSQPVGVGGGVANRWKISENLSCFLVGNAMPLLNPGGDWSSFYVDAPVACLI